jgi:hypothetical protein
LDSANKTDEKEPKIVDPANKTDEKEPQKVQEPDPKKNDEAQSPKPQKTVKRQQPSRQSKNRSGSHRKRNDISAQMSRLSLKPNATVVVYKREPRTLSKTDIFMELTNEKTNVLFDLDRFFRNNIDKIQTLHEQLAKAADSALELYDIILKFVAKDKDLKGRIVFTPLPSKVPLNF